jgi:hypothetical protein
VAVLALVALAAQVLPAALAVLVRLPAGRRAAVGAAVVVAAAAAMVSAGPAGPATWGGEGGGKADEGEELNELHCRLD